MISNVMEQTDREMDGRQTYIMLSARCGVFIYWLKIYLTVSMMITYMFLNLHVCQGLDFIFVFV